MTESISKVVVTWSGYRDRILKRSGLEGYEHLEFLFSDDKDEIVSGLDGRRCGVHRGMGRGHAHGGEQAALDTRNRRGC